MASSSPSITPAYPGFGHRPLWLSHAGNGGGCTASCAASSALSAVVALVALARLGVVVAVPTSPRPPRCGSPGSTSPSGRATSTGPTVASTPVRYVIMRATIGNTADRRLASSIRSTRSTSPGRPRTGSWWARTTERTSGTAENDATSEANYFVNNAQIAAGDVLPVLDIEKTHGLTVPQMQDWVREWVQRVFARTGVKPMIYTSPNFWLTNMGDTPWFADHGYPLWIAHWGVSGAERARGELGRARLDVLAVDLHRTRRGDRRRRRPRPFQRHEPGAGEDRVPRGDTARRRRRSPAPGSTAAAPPRRAAGSRTPTRWSRSPPRPIRARRCSDGPGRAAAAGSAPTCDVSGARREDGLGRVRLPGRGRAQGSGAGTVTSSPSRLDCGATCTALFAVGVDGDPHRGGGLRVGLRRLERRVHRHRSRSAPSPVSSPDRRGGDVRVRGERGGGRCRHGLRVGTLDRRARDRRLLPLGAPGRRLGDVRVLRRRGDAVHGLGTRDGEGADPDRRGGGGDVRRLRDRPHGGREASLRGSGPGAHVLIGRGARHEASRRGRDAGGGGRAPVGRSDARRPSRRVRSGGRPGRMPRRAAGPTRSATCGTRPPSSRSRGPACRSARCADRRWAGRRSGWTARS